MAFWGFRAKCVSGRLDGWIPLRLSRLKQSPNLFSISQDILLPGWRLWWSLNWWGWGQVRSPETKMLIFHEELEVSSSVCCGQKLLGAIFQPDGNARWDESESFFCTYCIFHLISYLILDIKAGLAKVHERYAL